MNNILLLAALCTGQVCADPYQVGPTTYVDYLYGTMRVESKFIAKVQYDDGHLWEVLVVNGYAPTITIDRLSTGGKHYVLDYRSHIPYKKPAPKPQSKLVPIDSLPGPVPIPPRSTIKVAVEGEVLPFGMSRPSDISDPVRAVHPQYGKSAEK